MFSSLKSIATLALAANVVLGVPTWRRTDVPSLSEWKLKNLESYYKFKTRYRNLGCEENKDTDFFNQCCVPLPKGQSPPEQCTSTSCSPPESSAPSPVAVAVASPAPTTTETDNGDLNDEDQDQGDDSNEGEDDQDLPYCDEVGNGNEPNPPSTPEQPSSSSTPAPAPEPTSTPAPAPEPTSTPAPAPEPTSTPTSEQPTTTEDAPPPSTTTPDNGDNSGNADVQTGGFATFYEQDGSEGACGGFNSDDEMIGAIDEDRYGVSSERSPLCGRRVHITNTDNGKSVTVVLVDDCPTCANSNSIDLSPSAFQQIANPDTGMVPISWYFI